MGPALTVPVGVVFRPESYPVGMVFRPESRPVEVRPQSYGFL